MDFSTDFESCFVATTINLVGKKRAEERTKGFTAEIFEWLDNAAKDLRAPRHRGFSPIWRSSNIAGENPGIIPSMFDTDIGKCKSARRHWIMTGNEGEQNQLTIAEAYSIFESKLPRTTCQRAAEVKIAAMSLCKLAGMKLVKFLSSLRLLRFRSYCALKVQDPWRSSDSIRR